MSLSKPIDPNSWDRRQHPLCRPTRGERGAEARRFVREFIQGGKKLELDDQHTLDEVVLDDDQGGAGPNAPPGALTAQQQRQRLKRHKKAAAILLDYILHKRLADTLREAHPDDGHLMLELYKRKQDIQDSEMVAADTRAEIQNSTILATVGFKKDSLNEYDLFLAALNATIDPARRVPEQELAMIVLRAIGDAAPVLCRAQRLRCARE